MADDTRYFKPEAVDAALGDMKLEEGVSRYGELDTANGSYEDFPTPGGNKMSRSPTPAIQISTSQSPLKKKSASQTPKSEDSESLEVVGGDITVTSEPGRPKLQRKSSQKMPVRPPPLYNDLPDATAEATAGFQVIKDCIYGSKYMGSTDVDILDCDCSEEIIDGQNQACRDDSVCINRATKLECLIGNCNCGTGCQNQRFQLKQWADVSVIKTERKDYGLRTNTDLEAGDFIYEYLGEVINEPARRRRAIQYSEVDGLKHFYFMHLTGNEIIDATKKGNLGRFCNHSCNPNCYVDKWVVGEKLRMGIFAKRHIKAGEELVFDYNADRYGSEATPCYCGEPNCSGWIGGKIQTDRANKLSLSHATIEALGIDDGDGWDTAVAKKPRKKKTGEDDEEYVSQVQPKGLDEDGVRKVMASLMQCKEKWIAVKLLSRIQRCDDDKVRNRVVQMHGYQILRTTLTTWKEDNDVILQVLDILYKFPRLTRNKIQDSKIEATVETLTSSEHLDVAFEAKRLLEEWGKLVVAYRIPRKKFDPSAVSVFERRNTDRAEEVTKSPQPAAIVAPTGPRNGIPSRSSNFNTPRPLPRRNFNNSHSGALPAGWYTASDQSGNTYYYSKAGSTTWQRPTIPAAEPPPPPKQPPKSVQNAKTLQDIIDAITKPEPSSQTPKSAPTADSTPKEKKAPSEKWRSLPQDKQMKLYENTLFPHIKYVMQKFTKQLAKEDLKKFAKEVGKKLVASDYKNNRVEDPTKISEKQEKKVKQYVRTYFEKAVQKKKELEQKKKEREARKLANGNGVPKSLEEPKLGTNNVEEDEADEADETMELTPGTPVDLGASPHPSIPATPSILDLKRKRDELEMDTPGGSGGTGEDSESNKRLKEESSTPPPPPPPPEESPSLLNESMEMQTQEETEEEKELRRQEEELIRENEEAMMMDMDGDLPSEEGKAELNGINAPHSHPNPDSLLEKLNGNGNGNGYNTALGLNKDTTEQVRMRR